MNAKRGTLETEIKMFYSYFWQKKNVTNTLMSQNLDV